MNLLRIIGWKLGLWRLVVLEDHDHELSLRRLRKSWHPKHFGTAYRMGAHCKACLNHDGTVSFPNFVIKWWLYPCRDPDAEQIAKLEGMWAASPPVAGTEEKL